MAHVNDNDVHNHGYVYIVLLQCMGPGGEHYKSNLLVYALNLVLQLHICQLTKQGGRASYVTVSETIFGRLSLQVFL